MEQQIYVDNIDALDAMNRIDNALAVLEIVDRSEADADTKKHARSAAMTALYENLDTIHIYLERVSELENRDTVQRIQEHIAAEAGDA